MWAGLGRQGGRQLTGWETATQGGRGRERGRPGGKRWEGGKVGRGDRGKTSGGRGGSTSVECGIQYYGMLLLVLCVSEV